MILTVTPNPSLDLLFDAGRLVWDDANRLPMPRRRVGGQGVNLVRAARALAPATTPLAVTLLGGAVGRELLQMLLAEGTAVEVVEVEGETRVFVGVRERDTDRTLLLNPRGPATGPDLADRVLEGVGRALDDGRFRWVACCGSLLPGLPEDLYARIGALARDRGARFVPDCDGAAMAAAVDDGPPLLVPNAHEAARLLGRPVQGVAAAHGAARELMDSRGRGGRTPEQVVVTLGAAGAVGVDRGGGWWARPRLPTALAAEAAGGSAVGAGDAFLAALLLDLDADEPMDRALARAVATGTAALLSRGADLVRTEDVERVAPHVRVEGLGG